MQNRISVVATLVVSSAAMAAATCASAQDLSTFGVLAGSTITNTGATVITGNIGVSPGIAITGFFSPGIVMAPYTIHANDGVAITAQSQLTTAYNILAGRPGDVDLTGQDLGGQTLVSGVYSFADSAQLTGDLTLDAQGDPNAVFVFNIESTLTTASNAKVILINSANANNVYFRVGSSATLGTSTQFKGKILALTSITLNTSTTINCGAALARNGAVTLDTNTIGICVAQVVVIGDGLDDLPVPPADTPAEVADAIDDYIADVVSDGGTVPLGFDVLALLTPAELAVALSQMAGEAATGVAPTGMQAMDSFLDTVVNQGLGDESGPGGPAEDGRPGRGTVKALGYASASPAGAGKALAAFDHPSSPPAPDPRLWGIWAAVYGGSENVAGDSAAGSHDRSSNNYGIALGLDYRITNTTKIGVALSGGGTSYSLADGFGNGSSDMFQGAIYGRTSSGPAYVAGTLAYAYHDETTERTITFAGVDRFRSDFTGHDIAGHVEAGYRMGWVTPYGAVRVQSFYTPAYSETTVSGNSTFALNYDAQTTTTTRTELGVRLNHTIVLDNGAALTLRGRIAWAHDFSSQPTANAGFQLMPGSSFAVKGADAEPDAVLLSAGAEVRLASGFLLAGWFDSQLADGAQTYAGNARVRYTW